MAPSMATHWTCLIRSSDSNRELVFITMPAEMKSRKKNDTRTHTHSQPLIKVLLGHQLVWQIFFRPCFQIEVGVYWKRRKIKSFKISRHYLSRIKANAMVKNAKSLLQPSSNFEYFFGPPISVSVSMRWIGFRKWNCKCMVKSETN